MNLQSYFYNCSPDYIDSIDPSLQVQITSIINVLGDFNIDRRGDAAWEAFCGTGLTVPGDLNRVPRSIFADPDNPDLNKFYDQVAWFTTSSGSAALSMDYRKGGSFDFLPHVYTEAGLNKTSISHRISDHYPLWVEFGF